MDPIITLMMRIVIQAIRDVRCKPGKHLSLDDITNANEFLRGDECKIILESVGINSDPAKKMKELQEV